MFFGNDREVGYSGGKRRLDGYGLPRMSTSRIFSSSSFARPISVAFAANRRLLHVQQLSHDLKPGLMTYHLRRLRLQGLIARIPKTHRYQLTDTGHRAALFYITSLSKVIRPAASELDDSQSLRYFFRRITQSLPVAKT